MDKGYPSISFKNKMEKIENNILELGKLAIKSNREAVDLLDSYDDELYFSILNRSNEIDIKAIDLERECIGFMATEQPVAHDLIFIESTIRIISHIKRIGRLFMKCAESIKNIQNIGADEIIIKKLSYMGDYIHVMLKKSLFAFLNQDTVKARELSVDDDKIDGLYDTILKQSIDRIEDKVLFINIISVTRYFERIADKTVNIGSRIIFMQTFKRPEIESE
ncbi:phosphate transport system protein [Methanobrevibacter gottschalkii]|uniref:Phosphate-specific transport system accessory protein PhoU n=1 Tax=Methanobrevibacter gottschalkii TaxID=190974 RepID=A0A1H7GSZ3_9EURY|nr:PhoU domain-containing protein [Methanobrevibacter gottschalkii]SEK41164.1 phosphate transport system protein [Methanobrevibacter gottschalkii]